MKINWIESWGRKVGYKPIIKREAQDVLKIQVRKDRGPIVVRPSQIKRQSRGR